MILAVVVPEGPAKGAYEKAASSLLCDCGCAPQSVKDCACLRAEELRTSIAADAAAGKSGDAIIAAYVAQNGEKILVAPPASGFNLIAWIGPAVGLLAAAVLLVGLIGRWKRTSREARAAAPAAVGPAVSDADLARLARDLEDLH